VLVCRYYLELSVADTAALLHITDGSVKRHAHRGITALAERGEGMR
jgi:DNA-directed RNA polymerase specialized sigma24 family protein